MIPDARTDPQGGDVSVGRGRVKRRARQDSNPRPLAQRTDCCSLGSWTACGLRAASRVPPRRGVASAPARCSPSSRTWPRRRRRRRQRHLLPAKNPGSSGRRRPNWEENAVDDRGRDAGSRLPIPERRSPHKPPSASASSPRRRVYAACSLMRACPVRGATRMRPRVSGCSRFRELERLFSAEPGNAEIGPVVSLHR